ncbi:MAG TPA: hypothetical protein VI685_14060 [Candidatus Angelobacter sp.]
MEKVQVFGRLFLAVPMGVFGAEHFTAAKIVASIVPSWIPGHLFWAYFVGAALIAAAVSITLKKYAVLAAALLGGMIFSFVLLIHVPNLVSQPDDRFALAVLLRDLFFSGGAFAFALAAASPSLDKARKMTIPIRLLIGIPAVVFGVEHFLHPEFVPVVPLNRLMPSWMPGHMMLAYVTGSVLIISGLSIIVNWRSRLAAVLMGVMIFVIVLLVYLPIVIAKPSDIGNGLNYLADTLAFCGSALLLAGIMPKETYSGRSLEERSRVATLSSSS